MKARTSVMGTLLLTAVMLGLTIYIAERGLDPTTSGTPATPPQQIEPLYDESTQIEIQASEDFEKTYRNNLTNPGQIKQVVKEYSSGEEGLRIDVAVFENTINPSTVSMYNALIQEEEAQILEVDNGEALIGKTTDQELEQYWECIWIHENARAIITQPQENEQPHAERETIQQLCKSMPEMIQ